MVLLSSLYLSEVYRARLTFTTQTETREDGGKKTEKSFVGGSRIWDQPEAADATAGSRQICFFRILPDSLLPPFVSPSF